MKTPQIRRVACLRWLLLLALCGPTLSVSAATRSWTGDGVLIGGVYRVWSDPNNWEPYGTPQNGEDLWFSDPLSPDINMVNDLTNLTVRTLAFNIADIGDASVHLYGETLGISAGISNTEHFECQVYIHCGVKLAGHATFVTGNTEWTSAIFAEETRMHFIGPIDLNGYNLVLHADAKPLNEGRLYIEGGISGTGNVIGIAAADLGAVSDNWGILEFRETGNSFSGTLTLNPELGAEIRFNVSSGVVVNDLLLVTNVGQVTFVLPEQIGTAATVRLQDGAQLQFHSSLFFPYTETFQNLELITDSNDSRPTSVDTGIAMLSLHGNITSICNSSAQTPVIKGKLNLLAGSHDIHVSGSVYAGLDIQAAIEGVGGFSKFGTAALLLTGNNSFSGSVSVGAGVTDVYTPTAFGATSSGVTLNGGSISLRNLSIANETLFVRGQQQITPETAGSLLTSFGVSAWTGPIELDTNLVVSLGDMNLSGPISGPGGLALHSGGTVQIGGTLNNTYTGSTLVRSPLVEFNKQNGAKAFAGPLMVGGATGGPYEARWLNSGQSTFPNVTLFANALVNLNGFNEDFGPINFHGGTIATGTGLLGVNGLVTVNSVTSASTISGRINLASGFREFRVHDSTFGNLVVSATMSGPGHLQKSSFGEMRLSASNSYGGLTFVDAGLLSISHPAGLGAGDSGTIVADGATLQLHSLNGGIVRDLITLRGHGFSFGYGALDVIGDATLRNQFPSVYACLSLAASATISTVGLDTRLTADGFINGTGPLIKTGAGSLVFSNSNPNTYTGNTLIQAGTLELRKPINTLSVPGNLVVGPATISLPAVARWHQTGGANANASITVNAHALLDLNGNNQTLATLNLNDGGDAQTGAGQLNFPAGGVVTVGTLNAPQVGLLASSSISGKIGLPALDYLTFNVGGFGPVPLGPDAELMIPALISGNGNISKNGGGTMHLSGANTFNDSPPFASGDLLIYGGIVIAANPLALGGTAGWTLVYNGARLALVGGILINNETLYLNTTNLTGLDNPGGHNTWLGPIIQTQDSGIGVNQDWSLTVQGAISGTGSLTKRGAGLLRLGGAAANTHSGDTFVDAGALWLTKVPNVQAVPANLIIGRPAGGTSASVMNVNSDLIWGNVTVNNGGLLNVNGYSEYIGSLTLNGGGDVQTGAGILHAATNITINPGSFGDQSVISGRLGLSPGTVQFTVNPGAPVLGGTDCLVSAVIGQSAGTSVLLKQGGGRLQLTGNNTYTGVTYVGNGVLQVDGVQPQSAVELDHETRLQGTGTVGHILFNGTTAVAPGASAGTLTCSNFDASGGAGNLEMEINGYPTGYDNIIARGFVDLRGLALQASLNFLSATSQQFILIDNDGADAVTGTFTGLPQNKKLYIGQELFQISYTGGTGNDVVLTRLVTPPPPTLTIERVSPASVRLLWPTNDPAFRLQSRTNLATANWISATPQPILIGTNHVVTNALTDGGKFYRLINL